MTKIQPRVTDVPSQTNYILRDYGGKLAVFTADDDTPIAVYDVYIHLLPENDIELLRRGITINSDFALQKALEDFGL